MNRNISVLSIAIAIIIVLRWIFNDSGKLLYIVAGINIVAITFVLYTIIEKVVNGIINRIRKSNVPLQIIEREQKRVKLKIWGWNIVIIVVAIIMYFSFGCSNLGNDIISILALGLSILDDEIVNIIIENHKI